MNLSLDCSGLAESRVEFVQNSNVMTNEENDPPANWMLKYFLDLEAWDRKSFFQSRLCFIWLAGDVL